MKHKTAIVLGGIAVAAGGVLVGGAMRWRSSTTALRMRILRARVAMTTTTFEEERELAALPDCVQRYFRAVLPPGQPIIAIARFEQHGTFNMGEESPKWAPFTANELVSTQKPAFDWDARIKAAPLVDVRVHDAYVAGEGILRASILGAFDVANLRDRREVAEGELVRYLAEAPWYPTALLPSQGVRWEAIDEHSARAAISDDDVTVSLEFRFDPATGLVDEVFTPARGRTVSGEVVPTPWRGLSWDYRREHGVLVPHQGEVAWMLPEGLLPYWRGTVESVEYEYADRA